MYCCWWCCVVAVADERGVGWVGEGGSTFLVLLEFSFVWPLGKRWSTHDDVGGLSGAGELFIE